MKLKDQLFIVRNSIFEKRNIIFTLVLTIIFLILFTALTIIQFSVENEIAMINSPDNRSYKIYGSTSKTPLTDKVLEEIRNIEHVELVYSNKYYFDKSFEFSDFDNGQYEGIISLKALNTNSDIKIKKGRNLQNKYELVCSDIFYPHDIDDTVHKELYVKSKDFLDKQVTAISHNEDHLGKKIPLTIVGSYKNKYEETANTCYTNPETFDEIVSKYSGSTSGYDAYGNLISKEYTEYVDYIVRIDSKKNFDQVLIQLKNMNLDYGQLVYSDSSFIMALFFIPLFVSIVVILLSLLIINFFISKKNINRVSKIGIMKALGYNEKNITKLNITENILIICISSLIAFIIYAIVLHSLRYTILAEVTYGGYILNIPFVLIILLIILFSLNSNHFVKKSLNKINKFDIIELLTK